MNLFENKNKHQTLSFKVEGNVLQYADDVVIYDKLKIAKPMRPGLYTVHAFIKPKAGYHHEQPFINRSPLTDAGG